MLLEGASGGRPTVQLGSARVVCRLRRLPASERWFPPDTAKPKLQILEKRGDGTLANVTNERTPRRLLSDVKVRWFHTKYNARGVSAPSAGVSRNDVDTWYLIFGRQLTCKM